MDATENRFQLEPGQLAALSREGFLLLPQRISMDVIDSVYAVFSRAVDRIALQWRARGLIADTLADLPLDERYLRLLQSDKIPVPAAWRRILVSEPVYQLWQLPELVGAVRTVIGDEVQAHGIWNGRPRDPFGRSQQVNWHQDAYYYKHWSADQSPLISAWIPLVPVNETSACMQFIKGSHKFGLIARERLANGEYGTPQAEISPAGTEVATVPMQPGDIVLFTDTTVHQSTVNSSEHIRWSIDIRFSKTGTLISRRDPRGYRCFSRSEPASVETYDTWRAKYEYDPEDLLDELTNFEEGYDIKALRAFSRSSAFSEVY